MVVVLFALILTAASVKPTPLSSSQLPISGQSPAIRDQAQAQALVGHNDLHLARLFDAQANCRLRAKARPE
jgi:hypothetical protein